MKPIAPIHANIRAYAEVIRTSRVHVSKFVLAGLPIRPVIDDPSSMIRHHGIVTGHRLKRACAGAFAAQNQRTSELRPTPTEPVVITVWEVAESDDQGKVTGKPQECRRSETDARNARPTFGRLVVCRDLKASQRIHA